MNNKSTTRALITVFALSIALFGCGQNQSASDTASVALESIFKKSASNEAELKALQAMPEYAAALDCMTSTLDNRGWNSDDHNQFMKLTGGDVSNLKAYEKLPESEIFEQVAALGALSECM